MTALRKSFNSWFAVRDFRGFSVSHSWDSDFDFTQEVKIPYRSAFLSFESVKAPFKSEFESAVHITKRFPSNFQLSLWSFKSQFTTKRFVTKSIVSKFTVRHSFKFSVHSSFEHMTTLTRYSHGRTFVVPPINRRFEA